jgi:predicted ATPase/DNA-binding XRE family transcriptional regulator
MQGAMSFGAWMRQRRQALDLTQHDLAHQVGCSAITITMIEGGRRRPSEQMALRLAESLQIATTEQAAFIAFARRTQLAPLATTAISAAESALRYTTSLPTLLTTLIGREHEMHAIQQRLLDDTIRLVTLIGPPGVGKTRLGIQVATTIAEQFADRACFVPLSVIHDVHLVPMAIANALGIAESSEQSSLAQVIASLRDKRMLLVLDNFEHLLSASQVVLELLAQCSQVKVLIMSREALWLRGERIFPVPPLAVPDTRQSLTASNVISAPAAQLFVERVQAIQPDFTLNDDNAATVAAICSRLDGLPLAIELAAARSSLYSPPAILAGLNDRFTLLQGGPRDAEDRHQTLHAAMTWSYNLLTPSEQQLFNQLGIFVGGASWAALEAICVDTAPHASYAVSYQRLLNDLVSLINKSLIQRHVTPNHQIRITMLETIRSYALEQLSAGSDEHMLRRRHAEYYLQIAEITTQAVDTYDQTLLSHNLELEYNNVSAAIDWKFGRDQTERDMQLNATH